VKKEELTALVTDYGDAEITYRSLNSRKLKYNVCTLDFSTPYIQKKRNRAKETDDNLLLFCWDTDSYRLLNPSSVTGVKPLSATLKNETV
jgi:hypothetical protein